MWSRIVCTALITFGLAADAPAQPSPTPPGFFDFGQIPGVQEPNVQIDLNQALLRFAAAATREDDPETADMIAGLDGLQLRVYEELQDAAAVSSFVDRTSAALEQQGWSRIVFVQDGEEKVRIYGRLEGDVMQGMTILVVDASEAVFINIAGIIDPARLGEMAGAVGIAGVVGGLGFDGIGPGGGPGSAGPPSQ